MPRTRITDEQIVDESFISEGELNQFFNTVVITGTEADTSVIQSFDQYFPGRNLITAGSNITVATGTNFVQISSTAAGSDSKAIVGDSFISVVTGTSTINLSADAIIGGTGVTVVSGLNTITINSAASSSVPNAIVGDSFISVISGTNTTNLSADSIVGITNNTTVISGSSTVTISGVVTVTSGIAYIVDNTRGNKSLSVGRETFTFNFNGLADNEYLRIGEANHASTGYPIIRPATITSISLWFVSGPNNKQFEIRKNGTGTSIKTLLVNPGVTLINDAENIDLDKGDRLQVFVTAAGTGAQSPIVNIEVAWRLL